MSMKRQEASCIYIFGLCSKVCAKLVLRQSSHLKGSAIRDHRRQGYCTSSCNLLHSQNHFQKIMDVHNAPPEITRFEHEIMLRGGQSFRNSLTPKALHLSKESKEAGGVSKARLVELVRENGRLRQELAQHKASLQAMSMFWEKAQQAFNSLKDGFVELSERIALAEDALLVQYGIMSAETGELTQL